MRLRLYTFGTAPLVNQKTHQRRVELRFLIQLNLASDAPKSLPIFRNYLKLLIFKNQLGRQIEGNSHHGAVVRN